MNPTRFGSMDIGPARVLIKADGKDVVTVYKRVYVGDTQHEDRVAHLAPITESGRNLNQQIRDCFDRNRINPERTSTFVANQLQTLTANYSLSRSIDLDEVAEREEKGIPQDGRYSPQAAMAITATERIMGKPENLAVYQLYGQGCLSALLIPTDRFTATPRS